MPKKTKPLTVWVCRDKGHRPNCSNLYKMFVYKPNENNFLNSLHWYDSQMCLNPKTFQTYFFELKPGAGPVKCEIEIRRVK